MRVSGVAVLRAIASEASLCSHAYHTAYNYYINESGQTYCGFFLQPSDGKWTSFYAYFDHEITWEAYRDSKNCNDVHWPFQNNRQSPISGYLYMTHNLSSGVMARKIACQSMPLAPAFFILELTALTFTTHPKARHERVATTLTADGPLAPLLLSNSTFCPSANDLKPSPCRSCQQGSSTFSSIFLRSLPV